MPTLGDFEPIGGREGAVARALVAYFGGAEGIPLVSRETDANGGRCLSDQMTDRLAIAEALGRLTMRQVMLLRHRYADHHPPREAAKRMHCDLNAVLNEEHAALEALVRVLWDEPGYTTPPRVAAWRRLSDGRGVRAFIAGMVRDRLGRGEQR